LKLYKILVTAEPMLGYRSEIRTENVRRKYRRRRNENIKILSQICTIRLINVMIRRKHCYMSEDTRKDKN